MLWFKENLFLVYSNWFFLPNSFLIFLNECEFLWNAKYNLSNVSFWNLMANIKFTRSYPMIKWQQSIFFTANPYNNHTAVHFHHAVHKVHCNNLYSTRNLLHFSSSIGNLNLYINTLRSTLLSGVPLKIDVNFFLILL